MIPPRRIVAAIALLGLPGCAFLRRTPDVAVDRLAAPLAEVDRLWARRAAPGGLDAVAASLDRLRTAVPDEPRVLVRLARLHWTLGELAPTPQEAVAQFENGRGYGYTCLLTFPAFNAGASAARWRVGSAAVGGLDAEAAPCLAWTAANGVGLVVTRGPGAALEIEQIRPLAERANVLAPDGESGMVAWTTALVHLLDRDPARLGQITSERAEARTLLEHAMALSPSTMLYRVELATWFPDARAEVFPLPAPPDPDPAALENARARARAQLLEALPLAGPSPVPG